jgi:hypothetical protein
LKLLGFHDTIPPVQKVLLPSYGEFELRFGIYGDGHMYLSLYQGHLCTTDLTVRIEDSMDRLEDGEFFFNRVKLSNYEDDIYDSGMFERTGKVIVSGHHVYPIWKYKKSEKFSD